MNRMLPRPLPGLLGIASLAALAWGLYGLLLTGSCSTPPADGLPPCPDDFGWHFLALFTGIVGAILSVTTGGGMLVFLGIFVTVGLTAIKAQSAPDSPLGLAFTLPFAGGFLGAPVLLVVGWAVTGLRRRQGVELMANGIEAIGTVLDVRDTGMTVNMNPRVQLRFRIEPTGGYPPPFEAEKTATVSRLDIPRPGDRYPVWIDPNDHGRWGFGSGTPDASAPPGVRRLWELARQGARGSMPAPPAPLTGDVVAQLQHLAQERAAGRIGDEEFARLTTNLLGTPVA